MKKVLSFFSALAIIVAGIIPVNYMISATEEDSTDSKIQIIAEDITVDKDDEVFTLLDEVSATDENGGEVEVTVLDDGDFDVTTIGEYTVTYQAIDPSDESEVTKERLVTVEEPEVVVEEETKTTTEETPVKKSLLRSAGDTVTVTTAAELVTELADVTSISGTPITGDTKTIIVENDITLTGVVSIPMNQSKNVIVKGATANVKLTSKAGAKHFNITTGTSNLTISDIDFVGNIDSSYLVDGANFDSNVANASSGGGISGTIQGNTLFSNCKFTMIKDKVWDASVSGTVKFENTTFVSNAGIAEGSVMSAKGTGEYILKNTTFSNNLAYKSWMADYIGSTIFVGEQALTLTVENSIFKDNLSLVASTNNSAATGGGAIAVKGHSSNGTNTVVNIKDSYFENNEVRNLGGSALLYGTTSDGGALYFFNATGPIKIEGNTFANNIAFDEGGAISFVGANNTANTVSNNTFYGNIAKGLQQYDGADSGGAVEVKSGTKASYVTFDSNTFTRNVAARGVVSGTQRAGGLHSSTGQTTNIKNNIISGNYVEKADGSLDDTDQYANTYVPSSSSSFSSYYKNLGNNVLDQKTIDVFGTDNPVLSTNETSKTAGNLNDGTSLLVPTVYIAPNNGSTALGKADTTGSTDLTVDERGFTRGTTKDVGSVEIYSITFDANRLNGDTSETAAYWSGTADTITYSADHKYAKYDDNGKTTEMVHATNYGGTIEVPTNPTNPDGYVFVGWNTDKEATTALSSTDLSAILTNVTSEGTVLYGIWKSSEVTLTYDANASGDSTVAGMPSTNPQTYTSGDEVTVSNELTRDGYKFTGWTTQSDGTGTSYDENDKFNITADTTLYAQWEELYNVTFDSQGGSSVASQNNKEAGSKVTEPTAPTREGYEFAGWHNEAGCTSTWDFDNDTITGHKTLYAKWTEVKVLYTVTFDSQGGSSVASQTGLASGSKVVEPSDPTREGYEFAGWYTDAKCTTAWDFSNDTITGNMTLYADWNKNKDEKELYTVDFDSQGGSSVDSQTGMSIGDKVTEPAIPTREGYYFDGWYTEAECVTAWNFEDDTISGNMTLYAKWTKEIIVDPTKPTDPKPSVKPEEKPSTQPETGDSTNLTSLLALLGLSSLTVLVAISRKKLFKK